MSFFLKSALTIPCFIYQRLQKQQAIQGLGVFLQLEVDQKQIFSLIFDEVPLLNPDFKNFN